MYVDNWQTQLRKGTLDIVILNLLSHGACHGYEMVQRMRKIKGLKIREGNVYPILARLKTDRLVTIEKETSPDGPIRNSYGLSNEGKKFLKQMNEHWKHLVVSIEKAEKGELK